jgi:aminopeptidase N
MITVFTFSAQILDFFEKYFDSPYQFPKLDSVAVPDFEAGYFLSLV